MWLVKSALLMNTREILGNAVKLCDSDSGHGSHPLTSTGAAEPDNKLHIHSTTVGAADLF